MRVRIAGALLGLATALVAMQPVSARAKEIAQSFLGQIGEYGTGCPIDRVGQPKKLQPLVDAPMKYEKRKAPNGKTVLVMYGIVEKGDAINLGRVLDADHSIAEIWLHSPGGNAAEGTDIGRAIRAHRLATRIPAGFQCISSCSIAFLGGIVRRIDPGGLYGVHTFYVAERLEGIQAKLQADYTTLLNDRAKAAYGNPQDKLHSEAVEFVARKREFEARKYLHLAEQNAALLTSDWAVYMSEMGVSRLFLREVVLRQASENFEDDGDAKRTVGARMRELVAQGRSKDDAYDLAVEEYAGQNPDIARQNRTYLCPSPEQMRTYNVVNVEN